MPNLLDRFDKKTPFYPTIYRESILDRFSKMGGGPSEKTFSQGKFFDNYYEGFIYAAMIGIKNNYRLAFDRAKDGTKFIEIEAWKPRELTLYIFMSLLALSETNLIEIEEYDDQQTDEKAFELIKLLEEYAYGGFDLINVKLKEDPHAFENHLGAITFLKDTKPKPDNAVS